MKGKEYHTSSANRFIFLVFYVHIYFYMTQKKLGLLVSA